MTSHSPTYRFREVFYRTVTPLHIGCGQDVGVVDLPVIRERTTGYPYAPGSGIRGALRDRGEEWDADKTSRLFGGENQAKPSAGCVSITDARLLFFPVRSSPGVFRWITCPFALTRYDSDRRYFIDSPSAMLPKKDPVPDGKYCGESGRRLYLEEYPFDREDDKWSLGSNETGVQSDNVVLVNDEGFSYFARNATIIQQRNHLSTAKTVLRGQLFTLEAVPPEAVFYGFWGSVDERRVDDRDDAWRVKEVGENLEKIHQHCSGHITLGGQESVGLGMTKMVLGGKGGADGSE